MPPSQTPEGFPRPFQMRRAVFVIRMIILFALFMIAFRIPQAIEIARSMADCSAVCIERIDQ